MLRFYLAATQFCLGDLWAPTTPSAKLTPAVRAQERLGWRLGLAPSISSGPTLFETIDKAAKLGLLYIGSSNSQKVSDAIDREFDEQITADEMRQIRLKLDAAGIRLLTYRPDRVPPDEASWHKVLGFAKRMGIEAIDVQSERGPDSPVLPDRQLDALEKLSNGYGILLARDRPIVRVTFRRDDFLIDKEIVCLAWVGANEDAMLSLLKRIHQEGRKPTMFSVECRSDTPVSDLTLTLPIAAFNKAIAQLASGGKS
jgi:hypothetical protein